MKKFNIVISSLFILSGLSSCSATHQQERYIIDIIKQEDGNHEVSYSIIYSDGTTSDFKIKNGEKGESSILEIKDGFWYLNSINTNIKVSGEDGISITSINLTSSAQNIDTYRISLSDGNHFDFNVRNAEDIEFLIKDGKIQYHLINSDTFVDLISLSDIYNKVNENVKNIELSIVNDNIVWSYVGESECHTLISLSTLIGKDGNDGKDGKEIELKILNGFITWNYVGEEENHKLVELSSLVGSPGNDGKDGKNAKEVTFSIKDGYLVWNYVGENESHNLIELSALVGDKGKEGREIELNSNETYITWNYVGETETHNLIDLASLQGPKGDDGLSAYEIYLKYHPFYSKDEEGWIDDLVNGRLKDEKECEHIYSYELIKDSSETEDGYALLTCTKCGHISYLVFPKSPSYVPVVDEEGKMIYELKHDGLKAYISLKVEDKNKNKLDLALHTERKVLVTPTTSLTGKISYQATFNNTLIQIDYDVPKASTYDWTWAFYNDFNEDGLPELLPTTYTNTTKYRYLYKTKESDIEGYPNQEEFGFSTDQEWDEAWSKDEQLYEEIVVAAINAYGEQDERTIAAYEQYNDEINKIYAPLEEKDEIAQKLFNAALAEFRSTHDTSEVGKITSKTTFEVEETNTLAYWLHVPFDYNESKSYPVVLFVPGEGGSFSDYVDAEGNVKGTTVIPYGAGWCNSWFANWYSQVKNPGESRDKYDCFMISIYPTNKFFRGETLQGHGTAIGINSMHTVTGLENAYTYSSEQLEGSSASYKSCYDSKLLEPAKDAQLAIKLIDEMSKIYNINLDRQYILGASLGGIFTMDTISHYPDRFAAAIPVVSAAADISEDNCKYLTNMNIWAISGSGDTNCSRFHSKLFINSINACKEKYQVKNNYVAQYSFFPGGHSCGYIGSSTRTANEGISITSSTQILDFLFDSSK